MFKVNKLNIFFEIDFFINKSDLLLKTHNCGMYCKFNSIRLFLFIEQIFDFNLLVYRRILAFCFFIFLINSLSFNIYSKSNNVYKFIGLKNILLTRNQIFEFLWNLYIFYIRFNSNIRRKEIVMHNCLIFNIYNLFLFPGFFKYYDDFEDLRFCSLKIVVLLSVSGIYMRLFLSSFNIVLLW